MQGDTKEYYQSALSQITVKSNAPRPPTEDTAAYRERQCPNVPEPSWAKPTDEQFYARAANGQTVPNVSFLKEHFFREGRLEEHQAVFILKEATRVLTQDNNLLHINGPVVVCGDIHGQYYDLMKLFDVGGDPAENTYLFLGDYVDRGCFGIECLLYLYTLKLCYPDRIHLLRGNHECRHLTEYFTFQRECFRKYNATVYEEAVSSFHALPLAALLDQRFLCLHGGLSPELNTIHDIDTINRFMEPPQHGLLCDILWSDPHQNFGNEAQGSLEHPPLDPGTTFLHNPTRGCSFYFTYEATCNFLARNSILGLIRGHEAQDSGYQMYRKTPKNFPSVITIFSAPNYCDHYRNRGAILKYVNKNITIRQFNSSSHPYWLPNFMDAFTWSLPFVGDKIVEMLLAILACCTAEELEESSEEEEEATPSAEDEALARRNAFKNKILAVGRMQRVFQILREEAETGSELFAGVDSSDPGAIQARKDALGVQAQQLRRSIRNFDDARRSDLQNEHIPDFPQSAVPNAFPAVQAPSTRLRRSNTADNVEHVLRSTFEDQEHDDERVRELADRFSKKHTPRPANTLKRHETF